jgi:hypothetical protein
MNFAAVFIVHFLAAEMRPRRAEWNIQFADSKRPRHISKPQRSEGPSEIGERASHGARCGDPTSSKALRRGQPAFARSYGAASQPSLRSYGEARKDACELARALQMNACFVWEQCGARDRREAGRSNGVPPHGSRLCPQRSRNKVRYASVA